MRIEKLLQQRESGAMSHRQYERLKERANVGFHIIHYDSKTGWDTSELDKLTESEAREELATLWKLQAYEQKHGIDANRVIGFLIQVHHTKEEPEPEWPPELQSYETDSFHIAYLCNKFNITPPQ